ncbi:hypothetical protein CJ030_MR2G019266 [Morella rubra]|uniref:Uncharacterized protein n=1 Tax=Morella rubra TaxID=262757 RepID=A0A6A1WG84_9ROSI|nr:hypothetical protein CJ030_MR2G019266 [Morella rubra]
MLTSSASDHFSKNASDGKDVDSGRVMRGSQKDLGSPVPESDDLVGLAIERHGEGAAEAKIGDLEDPPCSGSGSGRRPCIACIENFGPWPEGETWDWRTCESRMHFCSNGQMPSPYHQYKQPLHHSIRSSPQRRRSTLSWNSPKGSPIVESRCAESLDIDANAEVEENVEEVKVDVTEKHHSPLEEKLGEEEEEENEMEIQKKDENETPE